MNTKIWLIVYGVIAAILVGGAGFFAASNYGEYATEVESWNEKVATVEKLERRVPFPNQENSEELQGIVEGYEKSVEELFASLNTFQRELNSELQSSEFQRLISDKVKEFRKISAESNFGIKLEGEGAFYMGFDAYSVDIPDQEMVAILDYELEAIDYLLRSLVDAGVSGLDGFQRDLIPGEDGVSATQESSVVHKYPVRLRFTSSYDGFQRLINKLANDKQFFYIVRVLKVRNEMTEGPRKSRGSSFSGSSYEFFNPQSGAHATGEMLEEWGVGEISDEELAQVAREHGFIPSSEDARILMGQEKLNVFMVVDIVRFISPKEQMENASAGRKGGDKK